MANEYRIYKNYYITDRKYVDISNMKAIKNVETISLTDEVMVWPKKPYYDGPQVEITSKASKEDERIVMIETPSFSFAGKNVLSIAVNGFTPCDRINITLVSTDGTKEDYMVNFFVDRWLRILVDVSSSKIKDSLDKIYLTFTSVKGFEVDKEYLYVGELYFGNIVDFQFDYDSTKYFATTGNLTKVDRAINYKYDNYDELIFPYFNKPRYSVLNALMFMKDTIKLTVKANSLNQKYKIYLLTSNNPVFNEEYSKEFNTNSLDIETILIKISDLSADLTERITGIKIVPLNKNGEIAIYDLSMIQERDFVLDDVAQDYMKKDRVKVDNPYHFEIESKKEVNVKDFGAKGDFYHNDTKAFQNAIDSIKDVGGVIIVPEGRYVLTHVEFCSNMELRLLDGALLVQSERKEDYDYDVAYEHDNINYTCEWAHNFLVHNKPMLYFSRLKNVKITGSGKIRMADTGAERLYGGYPYYDIHCNSLIHIVPMVFNFCENVEISGITVSRANSYHCFNNHVKNLFINDFKCIDPRCLSGDGIGLSGSKNVKIANLLFVSNDDGITINPGYDDPRAHNSYWDQTPGANNSIENIELCYSYLNSAYGSWGKAFAFIPWGKNAENQENSLITNIYIHDNILKGGCSIGTWCDDPYHGKAPFDNSELDDYSPIEDIILENNKYLSPCSLMEIKVTNMVSDCNLHSSYEIVNGNFVNGMANWKSLNNYHVDYRSNVQLLNTNDNLYQIIYSKVGNNSFSFKVCGSGLLNIDNDFIEFNTNGVEEVIISKNYSKEQNIKVGITAKGNLKLYEIKRV